jgi:adenylate kinase family enzyme
MRIVILGNSGSGKSTLARELARAYELPALDLDTVFWEPDRIAVQRDERDALAQLAHFCRSHDGWIVEGCYAHLATAALAGAPMLLWLDPGVEACLANCRARPWEPHKYRTQAEQDAYLEPLLAWVADFYDRDDAMSQRVHRAVFERYAGPKRRITSREEAAAFVRHGI